MARFSTAMVAFLSAAFLVAPVPGLAAVADPPTQYVMAIYFHRTERCPTCKKMGSYAEEAVKQEFAKELKAGSVKIRFVDYQDAKNAAITKAYKVEGPALIVVQAEKKRAKKFKNLKDIWTKVAEKPEFIKYVCENVRAYMK